MLAAVLAMGCATENKTESAVAVNENTPSANTASMENQSDPKGKTLILYYSLTGNTRAAAEQIQSLVGGDLEEIKTERPYPEDFHALVEQAREERRTGYLPPIQPIAKQLESYDVIYLGFPIWGSTIPQPVATFLSQNHLAGKTIVPFCTHDGYGAGRSFQVVADYCPSARILEGFDMIGSEAKSALDSLSAWLQRIHPGVGAAETPITVSFGDTVLSGTLNGSPEAKAFMAAMPQSVSMVQYGGREYYGAVKEKITAVSKGRLRFEDGDITYCPQNHTVAIFFSQTDRPNLTMEVIPIGKVTSDLSVFRDLGHSVQVRFDLKNEKKEGSINIYTSGL